MNKKSLTLLEILISTIILALVVTGIVNVFISGKQFIQHSSYRIGAGEIGKQFIDPFQNCIRQDTWNTSPFAMNSSVNQSNGTYTASYVISNLSNITTLKRVGVTISWTE